MPNRRSDRTAQDLRLFERYWSTRDPRARDALVERFLPMAHSVANRFRRGGEPLDDLEQVAVIGLIKAIDRFDGDRGLAFSTFAVPTILGELKRYLRDRTWSVRPPRDLLERSLSVNRAADGMVGRLGRRPTVPELCIELGPTWDEEDILEALYAHQSQSAKSLQARLSFDPDTGTLEDQIGDEDPGFEHAERRAVLDGLLRMVSPRERHVLHLRYQRDLTQAEIGSLLGISQMQVSRIVRAAVERMRDVAATHAARDREALAS